MLRRVLGRHRESKLGQHDEGVFNALHVCEAVALRLLDCGTVTQNARLQLWQRVPGGGRPLFCAFRLPTYLSTRVRRLFELVRLGSGMFPGRGGLTVVF